jgi:hypothetical protein
MMTCEDSCTTSSSTRASKSSARIDETSGEDQLELGDGFRIEIDVRRRGVLADLIRPRGADDSRGEVMAYANPPDSPSELTCVAVADVTSTKWG